MVPLSLLGNDERSLVVQGEASRRFAGIPYARTRYPIFFFGRRAEMGKGLYR